MAELLKPLLALDDGEDDEKSDMGKDWEDDDPDAGLGEEEDKPDDNSDDDDDEEEEGGGSW